MIKQIGLPLRGRPILLITRMITDRIGLHSVLLPLLIWLLFSDKMSVTFCIFFLSTEMIAILLSFFWLAEPEALMLFFIIATIPRFIVGLGTAYLLSGQHKSTECSNIKFWSPEHDSSGNKCVWVARLSLFATFAAMLDYILFRMLLLGKRYYFNPVNLSGAESTVSEQATFKHSTPIFLRILFFIVPIISGFSFGCIIGMTVEPSDYRYCIIIHFLAISLFVIQFTRLLPC